MERINTDMNILFMSLGEFEDLSAGSVHIDVVKELSKTNEVYLACKRERRSNKPSGYTYEEGIHVLRVQVDNVKRTSLIRKGISTITLEKAFLKEMKKCFNTVRFDLIIYTTPPITFVKPIKYFKNRDCAKTYLMLKDIFPQNAVDLGMLSKKGLRAPIYNMFRKKERALYRISDRIGCMSPANVAYILNNNPEINRNKVEIFPNCINIADTSLSEDEKKDIRKQYGIPEQKKVFVYGGNLGKPQGIPFVIDCLKESVDLENVFFLIVGNGTEYQSIQSFIDTEQPRNVKLLSSLPKKEYEQLVSACDVGMLFLDHRFTIPNFPARLLSYLQAKLPVLAVTDRNTDVGEIVVNNGFGWWVESNSLDAFSKTVMQIIDSDTEMMGKRGFQYLNDNHNVKTCCERLLESYK